MHYNNYMLSTHGLLEQDYSYTGKAPDDEPSKDDKGHFQQVNPSEYLKTILDLRTSEVMLLVFLEPCDPLQKKMHTNLPDSGLTNPQHLCFVTTHL